MGNLKPTWKSTEFWFTAIGVISGLVMAIAPQNDVANVIGCVLASVFGSAYTLGRSSVKGRQTQTSTILELAKKKSSKTSDS